MEPSHFGQTAKLFRPSATLGSNFFKKVGAIFRKKGLCIGRGSLGRIREGPVRLGHGGREASVKEGLTCREATTDPKLTIFATQARNANAPILVRIGTEEVATISQLGRASNLSSRGSAKRNPSLIVPLLRTASIHATLSHPSPARAGRKRPLRSVIARSTMIVAHAIRFFPLKSTRLRRSPSSA